MKNIFYVILFLFCSKNIYSQKQKLYSCEEIKNTILDERLFDKLSNGKLIAKFDLHINKVYKIIIKNDDNNFYYVSKTVMKKIKKSIKINNCKGIEISKIDKLEDINFKIIRN